MSANFDNPDSLGLAAFGQVQALLGQIPALRRKPHEHVKAPVSLLKYADEQAVVSIAAVFHAIHDFGLHDTDFTNWGVVAAPRFLGRETCVIFLDRFARQGPLGTSPLLAVYQSLHAVSGSVSLALHIHGPNMGVGGGHRALEQTLLAGLAMQSEHQLPGIWMVFSEWDPEAVPDGSCKVSASGICRALCLAFKPVSASWQGLRLRLRPGTVGAGPSKEEHDEPSLAGLGEFLAGQSAAGTNRWHCPLSWNGRLELTTECHSQAHPILAA